MRWIRTGISLIQEKIFIIWKQFSFFLFLFFCGVWCFALTTFLSNEGLRQYFPQHLLLSLGKWCVNIWFISNLFTIISGKLYLHLRVSLLLSPSLLLILLLMSVLLVFSLKLNSRHPCNRHWKHHLRVSHNCYTLIWWFVSIKLYIFKITYFLEFSFWYLYLNNSPEKLSLFHLQISLCLHCLDFCSFFFRKNV